MALFRITLSLLVVFITGFPGEVFCRRPGGKHGFHGFDPENPKSARNENNQAYNYNTGDDDKEETVNHALVIGGFIFGGLVLATVAIIVTICCLKKAKRAKTLVAQDPSVINIATIDATPRKSYRPPYSRQNEVTQTRTHPFMTDTYVPYNLPQMPSARFAPVENGAPPRWENHAESPPPPYTVEATKESNL